MDLIVDANILFAVLIKESVTSDLLFVDNFHLYAPEFLLREFEKYKEEILRKTHRSDKEFNQLMSTLERRINFTPLEEIKPFLNKARNITPDEKDAPYFAVALKVNGAIWSNDYRLRNQNKVRVYTTKELLRLIENKTT